MGTSHTVSSSHDIILFDGVCNLCNGAVQFILKRDKHKRFLFASLQSDVGQQKLRDYQLSKEPETILLLSAQRVLDKSNAALEIARHLSGPWPLLYTLKIVPRFIRDAVYSWIAKNRYRFFGKREVCMIPTPELKSRFIE